MSYLAFSASFEYLCYESMIIINIVLFQWTFTEHKHVCKEWTKGSIRSTYYIQDRQQYMAKSYQGSSMTYMRNYITMLTVVN